MIRLYYHPGNASLTPHMLLEELGVPFTLELVDRARCAHKSPGYLKLNPNGQIPVLVDGDLVLYETAAICGCTWRTRIPMRDSRRRFEPPSGRISTSGWCGPPTRCKQC